MPRICRNIVLIIYDRLVFFYLKLTAACQTKAKRINSTGITGIKSIIGAKGAYASGSFASNIAKDVIIDLFSNNFNRL